MPLLHISGTLPAASTVGDFLTAWEFEPIPLAALLTVGGLYFLGRRRLARRQHHVREQRLRHWCFVLGYAALALALLSPVHVYSEALFAMHMVQHLLLLAAAPLLLLANPLPVVLWSLPTARRTALGRLLVHDAPPVAALRRLTNPYLAWWLFVLGLWLWHQPAAYQAALRWEVLHYLQHACFFGTAVLFWWPIVGPAPLRSRLPYPARMLYLFLAWIPNSMLGAGITFAPDVLMPTYASQPRHWGLEPLTDQQLAGLLMWIPGDLMFTFGLLALLLATLRREDRVESRQGLAA